MKNNTSLKEELKSISPLLSKIKEGEPTHKVPPNYFHNLQVDVWNKINAELQSPSVTTPGNSASPWYNLIFQRRFAWALSALIAVCIGFFLWNSQQKVSGETIALEEISQDEIFNYIEQNISGFEPEDFVEISPVDQEDLLHNLELDDKAVDIYLDKIIEDLDDESLENLF